MAGLRGSSTILTTRNRGIVAAAVFLFYLLLFFAAHPAVWKAFASHFIGGARSDAGIYIYLLEQHARTFCGSLFNGFSLPLFLPFGRSLAFTDNFLLPGFVAAILRPIEFPLPLVYNSMVVLASAANGLSVFLAGRLCRLSLAGSIAAGTAFMFCAFFSSQWAHPQLQFAFFIPLSFCCCIAYFKSLDWSYAFGIGAAAVLAFCCSVYYAVFIAALCTLVCALTVCCIAPKKKLPALLGLAAANLPNGILLYFLAAPYLDVRAALGAPSLFEVTRYGGSLSSFISAKPSLTLWGGALSGFGHFEARFFPSFTALMLAAAAFCSYWRSVIRRLDGSDFSKGRIWIARLLQAMLLLTIAAFVLCHGSLYLYADSLAPHRTLRAYLETAPFWLALGTALTVLTLEMHFNRSRAEPLHNRQLVFAVVLVVLVFFSFAMLGVPGGHWPQALRPGLFICLRDYFPGFSGLRAAGRIGILALFALCLWAGYGVHLAHAALRRRHLRAASLATCCIPLLIFIELDHRGLPLQAENPPPPLYSKLDVLTEDGAVIVLPFPSSQNPERFALVQTDYMRAMQQNNKVMVNGYSGKIPRYQWNLHKRINDFPSLQSIRYLGRIPELRYVVYDPRWQPGFDQAAFEAAYRRYPEELPLIARDKHGSYLFELKPSLPVRNLELFLAPSMQPVRSLTLTALVSGSRKEDLQHEIPLTIKVQSVNGPQTSQHLLKRLSSWQEFTVEIPPSPSRVLAQKISIGHPPLPEGEQISVKKGPCYNCLK